MSDSKHLPKKRVVGEFQIFQNDAPLYERAPTKDENGKAYADFMMLIPGLNKVTTTELKLKMAGLHAALVPHEQVVFADLNLKLNILWVSFKPQLGLIHALATAIQAQVPEAKLISAEGGAMAGRQ